MAGIAARGAGAKSVVVLERNEKAGKKLYITGKGRCNVTNDCTEPEFLQNVVSNPKFLYKAIYAFPPPAATAFFKANGLELKTERGRRVFPASDKSSDVTAALLKALKASGAELLLNKYVSKIQMAYDNWQGTNIFEIQTGNETFRTKKLIIACGGLSYPATGSTGDGYKFARELGHTIISPRPALAPVLTREGFAKRLQGLSLRNAGFRVLNAAGKTLYSGFGELLFTDKGVSGPVVLSASSLVNMADFKNETLQISIDLKPALTYEQLDARILRDFSEGTNRQFKNSLDGLLPKSLIPVIIELSRISEIKALNQITKEERGRIAALLKDFRLTINGLGAIDEGIVTAGGVDVKEVDPSTMESRIVPSLYFAGETLDVDALTGGYNIHIALATGRLAGLSSGKPARINT